MFELFAAARSYFGVNVSVDTLTAFAPAVGVVIFAIPTFISVMRQRGPIRGLLIYILLALVTVGLEVAAFKVELYGKVSYSNDLGAKIVDTVPWTLALIYSSVAIGSFWLARKMRTGWFATPVTAALSMLVVLVLQPAAVKLGMLKWEHPGPFWGIPVIAFIGWFVGYFIAAWLLKKLWGDEDVKRGAAYSTLAIIAFWTGVNTGINLTVPAAIGAILTLLILILMFTEKLADRQAEKERPRM